MASRSKRAVLVLLGCTACNPAAKDAPAPPSPKDKEAALWAVQASFDKERWLKHMLGDFDLPACAPSERLDLDPVGVDAVALRRRPARGAPIETLSTWQTPCAKARDPRACELALAALPIDPPLKSVEYGRGRVDVAVDLVTTSGDRVGRVSTFDELRAVLGTIDTVCEAALLPFLRFEVTVPRPRARPVRKDSRGYVFLRQEGDGCHEDRVLSTFVISSDGRWDQDRGVVADEEDPVCHASGR